MRRAREQEIRFGFAGIPERAFAKALELGAGDCFQSRYLRHYVSDLICTDFSIQKLDAADSQIRFLQCDAEKVAEQFSSGQFDLVFSSNMLQHCPNQNAVLDGTSQVLSNEGIAVFVMPNVWWKAFKFLVFYPGLLIKLPSTLWRKFVRRSRTNDKPSEVVRDNNPKFGVRRSRLRRLLLPVPIGAYRTNFAELLAFRRCAWTRKFLTAGFQMVSIRKGPFIIGDFADRINDLFANLGLCTEYIYILRKSSSTGEIATLFATPVHNPKCV